MQRLYIIYWVQLHRELVLSPHYELNTKNRENLIPRLIDTNIKNFAEANCLY